MPGRKGVSTPLIDDISTRQAAEEEKRGAIVKLAAKIVGGIFGGPAGAAAGSRVGERAEDERTKTFPGSSLLKRSTRGSKAFTASEIKKGYRKL